MAPVTWDDRDDSPSQRTRSPRRSSVPLLPLVMIAIGVSVVFDRMVGGGFSAWELFWLAVGIWCLARARDDGPYPLLVIGAFLVGNNTGELIGTLVSRDVADATETLGTAAGFLWLYFTDRPRSRWAIFVALIAGFIGMAELGAEVTEVAGSGDSWLLPAGVIVAGVLLLGAHRLPGPVRLGGLIFVGAAILSLLGNDDEPRRDIRTQQPVTTQTLPLLELDGRRLRIEAGNGAVTVNQGETPRIIEGQRVNSADENLVVVRPRFGNGPVVVEVPPGTPLEIEGDNGPVTVLSPTSQADISLDDGPITIHVKGDPDIDAESDVIVTVDGRPEGDDYEHDGADDGEVELRNDNAPITITHTQPAQTGAR